ncbi:HEXXH motif-containing putative peptide modification protein [Streptomyces sp. NPDC005474]|uniref:aKG-HExxH-type peptide beta-hydroxylase n=1 Tax=Streptomyces sp. NPDC005474 TaxID=3154878 RepID=UPI0034565896
MSEHPSSGLPSTGLSSSDAVARADILLCADRQFGDSTAVGERNYARFRLGLTMLARRDDTCAQALRTTAAEPEERLRPLLFDPVLRHCFEDDILHLENGTLERSTFGRYLAEYRGERPVSDPSSVGPCEGLTQPRRRAWPGLGNAWLLTELKPRDPVDEMLGERLMELYRDALGDSPAQAPVNPTSADRVTLREGAELLASLMPEAGASVLGHITMVGFTRRETQEGPLQSMSGGDPLPSSVLMAPERCTSPWLAAESLLHEGSHLKLFDALRTGSVVRNATERVPIPWRIGSWTVIRVFVALHFYVHLLVFQAAAAAAATDEAVRKRFGPPPAAEIIDEPSPGTPAAVRGTHRTSAERARCLAERVLALPEEALTENGHRFARWLLTVLHLVDGDAPTPPDRAGTTVRPSVTAPLTGVLQRVTPVDACALPSLGQLVVGDAASARMHWLNSRSWTVYSLCDGRDLDSLRTAYADAAGLPAGSAEADRQVSDSVRQLVAAGLVTRLG